MPNDGKDSQILLKGINREESLTTAISPLFFGNNFLNLLNKKICEVNNGVERVKLLVRDCGCDCFLEVIQESQRLGLNQVIDFHKSQEVLTCPVAPFRYPLHSDFHHHGIVVGLVSGSGYPSCAFDMHLAVDNPTLKVGIDELS